MLIGHVLVGVPVILPAFAIQQIAKLVFLVFFQIDRCSKASVFESLHWVSAWVPIVEIRDNMHRTG